MADSIRRIIDFHGHAGMWAALGYKAGESAKKFLAPQAPKELHAEIKIIYNIPFSCFIDGFQVASCCTTGKCNLKISASPEETPEITVRNIKSGRQLIIIPKKEIIKEIKQKEKHQKNFNDIENTKWIVSMKSDDLFETKLNFS